MPKTETAAEEFARLTALPLSKQTKKVQARIAELGNLPENCGPRPHAYGDLTVAELREVAKGKGLSFTTRTPKAKLLELLNEQAPAQEQPAEVDEPTPATPEPTPAPVAGKAPKTAKKTAQAEPSAEAPASKGQPKAAALGAALEPFGWEVAVEVKAGDRAEIRAKRGEETLFIAWDGGVFNYDDSVYTNGARNLRPRNVSAARQRCAVPID